MPEPLQRNGDAPAPRPEPRRRGSHRTPEQDSTGRELALQLPDWDLLPPAEFLDRHQGR